MRRHKEEVLPELPDLIEINYPNELDHKQKAIYLAQLRQMQETIAGASDADINRRKIEILSGITRCGKFVTHQVSLWITMVKVAN